MQDIEEEKQRLDRVTKILIGKDIELQKAYDKLEQAYNQVEREKRELLAERNKLSVVLSGISDAIIALDNMGYIVTFNRVAENFTGYSQEEAVGKQFGEIITIQDGDVQINESILTEMSQDPKGIILERKSVHVTSKKPLVYADILVTRIFGREMTNVGFIITLHDVSEQKQLEEMKLDFVSMAAHELRTPLTAIGGYLSVFMQENKGKFDTEQTSFLNRISISTQRLASLVENLLNVSKIERGALMLTKKPMNWVEHTKQIVEEFSIQAKEEQVNLKFTEPTMQIPQIAVDVTRITEVLANLISNAITYTKMGDTVEITIEYKDGSIVTNVIDHGPGIPESALPHLFTKFFRVSGKLEQGSKGTGLGLYISKAIVEMHKGKIWVTSTEGKGSVFSFALPIENA